MRLYREQKEKIKSLLGRMGARQKELCTESGHASGNMSDFLSLSKDKGANPETWANIVDALERMANKPHRKLLCQRDPSIFADIKDIRGWSDKTGTTDHGAESSPPPNGKSSHAKAHVKRKAEKAIPQILQSRPASVIVRGGACTGRSSWLSCFHDAAAKDGARVVAFDETELLDLGADAPVKGFCRRLAEELDLPALAEIDTSKGGYRDVAREILTELSKSPRDAALFLLIDDVEAWSDGKDFSALTAVIEQIQLQLAGRWGQKPEHPICVVSALTPRDWPALIGSRLEAQSQVVSLSFLTREQVRHLASHYGVETGEADTIAAYTGGHPYHTQLLLWSCHRHGEKAEEAIARARQLDDSEGWRGIAKRITTLADRLAKLESLDWVNLRRKFVRRHRDGNLGISFAEAEFTLLKALGMVDGSLQGAIINRVFLDILVPLVEEATDVA